MPTSLLQAMVSSNNLSRACGICFLILDSVIIGKSFLRNDCDLTRDQKALPKGSRRTMANLQLTHAPITKAEMLIRKPAAEVFAAFVDPEITRRFWFTKSTGRMETGKHIVWTWAMYDMSIEVDVKEVEPNKRIVLEWGNYGSMTTVELVFTPLENDATYVTITNSGFQGDGDKVVRDALDQKEGLLGCLQA